MLKFTFYKFIYQFLTIFNINWSNIYKLKSFNDFRFYLLVNSSTVYVAEPAYFLNNLLKNAAEHEYFWKYIYFKNIQIYLFILYAKIFEHLLYHRDFLELIYRQGGIWICVLQLT